MFGPHLNIETRMFEWWHLETSVQHSYKLSATPPPPSKPPRPPPPTSMAVPRPCPLHSHIHTNFRNSAKSATKWRQLMTVLIAPFIARSAGVRCVWHVTLQRRSDWSDVRCVWHVTLQRRSDWSDVIWVYPYALSISGYHIRYQSFLVFPTSLSILWYNALFAACYLFICLIIHGQHHVVFPRGGGGGGGVRLVWSVTPEPGSRFRYITPEPAPRFRYVTPEPGSRFRNITPEPGPRFSTFIFNLFVTSFLLLTKMKKARWRSSLNPANTRHWASVGFMLVHHWQNASCLLGT